MSAGLIILIVVVAVALLLVAYAVAQYNALVSLRNKIEGAYAQIDVQLHRRHDLIPNLVETVKGYATHERETLEGVIAARDRATAAQGVESVAAAETGLSAALRGLLAVAEDYPDLKANQNFQQLQTELSGTEDRIAYARQYYNDVVRSYNEKIQRFPTVLVANAFSFSRREYFEADEATRANVEVDFDR